MHHSWKGFEEVVGVFLSLALRGGGVTLILLGYAVGNWEASMLVIAAVTVLPAVTLMLEWDYPHLVKRFVSQRVFLGIDVTACVLAAAVPALWPGTSLWLSYLTAAFYAGWLLFYWNVKMEDRAYQRSRLNEGRP